MATRLATSFIEDLYVNFDFDGAQQKLRDCETVLVNDFFLVACLDDFIENSRMMIFEAVRRISSYLPKGLHVLQFFKALQHDLAAKMSCLPLVQKGEICKSSNATVGQHLVLGKYRASINIA